MPCFGSKMFCFSTQNVQQSYSILVFGFFLRTDTNWFDCLATIQQVEERLHCMLCQVYVLSQTHLGDDDVWSMLGKEKVIFPSKKAGVVTQALERFEKQAVVEFENDAVAHGTQTV